MKARIWMFTGALSLSLGTGVTIAQTSEQLERLAISDAKHLSAASKRALEWPKLSNDWYGEFRETDLKGDFAYQKGIVRRDPSSVLYEDELYHTWYTKSTGPTEGFSNPIKNKVYPWDKSDIWHASSKDGIRWKEDKKPAVVRGKAGSFDDRSVFTPEVLKHEGRYYLVYQTVKHPYIHQVKNQVGIAYADSPYGPWIKHDKPILSPADNGKWLEEGSYSLAAEVQGDFDSHKVHDPYLTFFNGKFHLYYKGERMGEKITFGGREIRHGVATSDSPFGPFVKSKYNPISNSGHEVVIWHYNGGIGSLITTDGPERNTVQWAQDGINFEILAAIRKAPHAMGLVRKNDNSSEPFKIFDWGLTHGYKDWNEQTIRRFDSRQPQKSKRYKN
ncbi:glycoside hydrolase family 117 protein [Agaribacterium sp. ZY112]|uniref:glycoside hydrolase family 117 protein n=1 Tax=Agaribacterium sp. ZY112 TaxID=3233574 RepID=UPI00352659A1